MPWALVTGAGARIGRALALALAEAGYDVVAHGHRSRSALDSLVGEIRSRKRDCVPLMADLTTPEGQDSLVTEVRAHLDRLEVLIHNSGLYEGMVFEEASRDSFDRLQALHVQAPFFVTQGLLPLLKQGRSPLVVAITDSDLARPFAGFSHYFASKAGLAMLVKVLALELAPQIRVNGVAPGTVAAPPGATEEALANWRARIPLQRFGAEQDVVEAVLYLVRNEFVTGQIMHTDGGSSL